MADQLIPIADGFWNIRGVFRVAGVLNVGTQSSLARLQSGRFVLLDSYTLQGEVLDRVLEITDGGRGIEAVLNLHPFHTVHVKRVAEQFPDAKLYGTARHPAKAPDLRWEPEHTEDAALHERYADDFDFTVPRGVDFIPANENLHFASVLAFHRATRTLHVDDTLGWVDLPLVGGLSFHPTLRWTLEKRPGAARDFREWAHELIDRSEEVDFICTAHGPALPPKPREGRHVVDRVRKALERVDRVLAAHERRYG